METGMGLLVPPLMDGVVCKSLGWESSYICPSSCHGTPPYLPAFYSPSHLGLCVSPFFYSPFSPGLSLVPGPQHFPSSASSRSPSL